MNLTTYSDFKNRIDGYPDQGTPESAKVVAVFHGQILVEDHGKYTFFFNSTAGSGVEIQDMKNTKNKLLLVAKTDGSVQGKLKLEAPQMVYLTAFFRAPPVGTDHVIDLQYQGPDTVSKEVDVPGKHWINKLDEEERMLQKSAGNVDCALGQCDKARPQPLEHVPYDATGLNAGFGCRFKFAPWKPAGVLPSLDALRALIPDAAAYLPYLIIPKVSDLSADIRAWHNQPWNNANPPDGEVLAYCEGKINITQSGPYTFTAQSHAGVELNVDGVTVVAAEKRNASADGASNVSSAPDTPQIRQGDISLPRGFHDLRLGAILCVGNACGRAPGDPILRVSATSPNPAAAGNGTDDSANGTVASPLSSSVGVGPAPSVTGDASAPATAPGAAAPAASAAGGAVAPPAVPGYWENGGIGDLSKLAEIMYKQMRAATPYAGERNPFRDFDGDFYAANKDHHFTAPPSSVQDDADLQDEVAKIIKPMTDNTAAAGAYAADGALHEVPEGVYSKPAPYDSEVVDIGGKGIPWVHREANNDLDDDAAVIGKDYVFTPWGKTIESVYAPSPSLDYHHPEFGGGIATPPTTFGEGKEQ